MTQSITAKISETISSLHALLSLDVTEESIYTYLHDFKSLDENIRRIQNTELRSQFVKKLSNIQKMIFRRCVEEGILKSNDENYKALLAVQKKLDEYEK